MQFEREISCERVHVELQKGSDKARGMLRKNFATQAERIDYLRQQFMAVSSGAKRLLENFNKRLFFSRGNDLKPSDHLEIMLFGGYEAVQCLKELNRGIHLVGARSERFDRVVKRAYQRLLQAACVFKTNGRSDAPCDEAKKMISIYRRGEDCRSYVPPPRELCCP